MCTNVDNYRGKEKTRTDVIELIVLLLFLDGFDTLPTQRKRTKREKDAIADRMGAAAVPLP